MRNIFLILLIIFFTSCTTQKLTKKGEVEKRWDILNLAIIEKWTQEKILQQLGRPESKDVDGKDETWFYYSEKSNEQEWSISFNLDSKVVINVDFNPIEILKKEFSLQEILKRWQKFNCIRKEERIIRGHTVHDIKYYSCDGNRRIDYNRYGEITWVRIKK